MIIRHVPYPGVTRQAGASKCRSCLARPPRLTKTKALHEGNFGAQSHGISTRCLRFAVRSPAPRKTRFWLPARLYQTGLITRRIPTKGFTFWDDSPFPSFMRNVITTAWAVLPTDRRLGRV